MTAAVTGDPGFVRTGDGAAPGLGGGLPAGPGTGAAIGRGDVGSLPGVAAGDSLAALELGADADASQITDQLADRVTKSIRRELQHAELQVRPAGLGPIQIDISMADGQANIQFTAAHPDTRHALQQSLPDLQDMLARRGYRPRSRRRRPTVVGRRLGAQHRRRSSAPRPTARPAVRWTRKPNWATSCCQGPREPVRAGSTCSPEPSRNRRARRSSVTRRTSHDAALLKSF
ncbi:MAG: flagellar hook-length control protein FliK [Burkholderiaceae bacterium]